MTDAEIIKALKCLMHDNCEDCPYYHDDCADRIKDPIELSEYALDLINRLQAKVIKEQNKNSKLRNERNRLQAQNKDLAEAVHNLILEKDALFDKSEELKSEVERLKEFIVETRRCDKEIKSEAVKEFAERLKDEIDIRPTHSNEQNKYVCFLIDDLVKEMVGEE